MGLGKFPNLIMTARQDHQPDGSHRKSGGPKVNFDLGGYDILYWDPDDLVGFRDNLIVKIRRRLAILEPAGGGAAVWNDAWLAEMRGKALAGLGAHGTVS